MENQNFTTTIWVNNSAKEVFSAINDPRGWWSEEIEGSTDKLNDEFTYHFKDIHRCKMKIIEMVPDKKVVWLVEENYFNFTEDKKEWIGTKISFEISDKDDKTQLVFTHVGLVPEYECYDVCHDAWTGYIQNSLQHLITAGKGQPNPKDGINSINSDNIKKWKLMEKQSFTTTFLVDQTPEEVFNAINNVQGWWTGKIEGSTDKPGAEFTYDVPGVHFSKQKITEFIPGKRVVWHVTDASLSFIKDKSEWIGTDIIFEITAKDDKTEVNFTHLGLIPDYECYNNCSNAWNMLVNGNLRNLIATGKDQPSPW